jgi:hypothetical protein
MSLLNRETILKAADIKSERVAVPEWGGEVIVRGLSALERDGYEQRCYETSYANIRGSLLVLALVDEAGHRLFSPEDLAAISAKSAAPLDRLFDVARRLSGIGRQELSELQGNSAPGRNGSSTSGSLPA